MVITHHEAVDTIDQIGDITETACLTAVAEDGEGLIRQSLTNKGRNNATITKTHTWTISIKDTNNLRIHLMKGMVGHGHRLCKTFGFIINSTWTNWVDITPIIFRLRVNKRIAIGFRCRGDKKTSSFFTGKAKGVMSSK